MQHPYGSVKEKILLLREQGKAYNQIAEELNCSKSTVAYHCGKGVKQKQLKRNRKNYDREWKREYRRRMKRKVLQAMGKTSCERCGQDHLATLQFHHTDPTTKENELRTMLGRFKFETILEEAKKCEILCANCHAIEHWTT